MRLATEPAEELIRVRLLANWCSSRELCELFNRMTTDGNYEWRFRGLDGLPRRLRITSDPQDPDYWVIINAPPPGEENSFDPGRTVVFQMEPLMWTDAMSARWGRWAAPSPRSYLQVRDGRRYRNSCDWWLGLSHAELRESPVPAKHRGLAACVSAKYFDPGHIRRLDFLRFLEAHNLQIDIFGAVENGFRGWRGETPVFDKRAALLPYRYYFDAENNAAPNFYTEKIVDCLLAETLCFYWGCPNLDSFFDPRAFIRLELEDFEADLARIRAVIEADEWRARLPYIRAEKQRILQDYGFFPTLARVLDPARRSRAWHASELGRRVEHVVGEVRAGTFVEISDREDAGEPSDTLDPERRLDWTGLCVESEPARVQRQRVLRDCIVAGDSAAEPVEDIVRGNGLNPAAVDWLNLSVAAPDELVGENGRLDPARVRANAITMPVAPAAARRRVAARLAEFGYVPDPAEDSQEAPKLLVRTGSEAIFGFYHLFTANHWREVARAQANRWNRSGLAAATRRIFAAVVGPEWEEAVALLADACGDRIEIVHSSTDAVPAERPILEYLRWFCAAREPLAAACWYMHGKGVSRPPYRSQPVEDWRLMMEHFLVDGWRDCVAHLPEWDIVGANWCTAPHHVSGNFWWASPRYLATLPERIGPGYLDPETWIGTGQPRVRVLHTTGVNHYLREYPPERYGGVGDGSGEQAEVAGAPG